MKPTAEMIEAGARGLWDNLRAEVEYVEPWDEVTDSRRGYVIRDVTGALTAALPLIEQAVAEQIAQKLESTPDEIYPKDVFIPVSTERLREIHEWLQERGGALDAVTAEIMRHAYPAAAELAREYAKEQGND